MLPGDATKNTTLPKQEEWLSEDADIRKYDAHIRKVWLQAG